MGIVDDFLNSLNEVSPFSVKLTPSNAMEVVMERGVTYCDIQCKNYIGQLIQRAVDELTRIDSLEEIAEREKEAIQTLGEGIISDAEAKRKEIQVEGEKVAASIPDDYPTLSNKINNASNALKGTASGEAVAITDISPIEHTMSVKVRSKNLLQRSNANIIYENKGITFEVQEDGTIKATGTATATAYYMMNNDTRWGSQLPIPKGSYVISRAPAMGCRIAVGIRENEEGERIAYNAAHSTDVVFEITSDTARFDVILCVDEGTTVDGAIFKPQLEIGATVTAYTPYADINAVSVKKYGANIFDSKLVINRTAQGLTTKVLEDGGISFKGTATANVRYSAPNGFAEQIILPRGTYTAGENLTVTVKDKTGKTTNKSKTFTLEESCLLYDVIFTGFVVGQSYDIVLYPCISVGSSAEYEPYKEPTTYTPNADGTVEGVTSVYPTTTLLTDTGVVIDCEYNRDINKAYEELTRAIISLGGNV